MGERTLGLVGAPNTRDLGGLVTVDGRRVRTGALLRASALGRLSDADVATLDRFKLAWVLDLRDVSEIRNAPPDRLPGDPAPRVRHVPVFDPQHPLFTYVSAVLIGHDLTADEELRADGTPGAMAAMYRWMAGDPRAHAGFGTALRAIADAKAAPLLFHCSAGKDRTGWLTAVVLELLGVARDDVIADYLATNDYSRAAVESIMDAMRARGRHVDPVLLRPVFEARLDYLMAAYDEVERCYGGIIGYLHDGLGVEAEVIAELRDALLE